MNDLYIIHYGVGHDKGGHSGRYPWGSGDQPYGETHGKKKVTARALKKFAKQNDKAGKKAIEQFNRSMEETGLQSGTHSIYKNKDIDKLGKKLISELRKGDIVNVGYNQYNARSAEKILKDIKKIAKTNPEIKKLAKSAMDTYYNSGMEYVDKFYDKYNVKDLYDDPKKKKLLSTTNGEVAKDWLQGKYNKSVISDTIDNYVYSTVADYIFNKYFFDALN